ncbi:MAG: 30S ribosomal protein S2 [Deltaproteobacteria bacterium]|nr:30S ribosomal protein S2 [Deltaproteobacteria bacterium]
MPELSMKEFLEAGVHFGHPRSRWNPLMKSYIFGEREGIHIIDLQKTVELCREACNFIRSITAQGKKVLFVGTKKQAQKIIEDEAKRARTFYVTDRWLGGTLTNFKTIRAGINHLKRIEDMEEKGIFKALKKKEVVSLKKQYQKLLRTFIGIREMKKLPGALFVLDPKKEHIAVTEAKRLFIPVVAVVDTNCNPYDVDYVIPGNDDAIKSIRLFSRLIADACLEGFLDFEKNLRDAEATVQEEEKEASAEDVLSIPEAPVIVNPEEYSGEAVDESAPTTENEARIKKPSKKNEKA